MTREPFELAIEPSQPRRLAGVGMLLALGLLTALLAVVRPPEALGLRVLLLLIAAAALALGRWMWRSSAGGLILDEEGLREAGPHGRAIAPIEAVEHVERGPFAFKPSNGFLLKTRAPGSRVWRPGIWWRVGRRVGVGGVLGAAQARAAADVMQAMLEISPPNRRSR